MSIHYSPSTNGFYISEINTNIPEDAREITETRWQELLTGQSQGQRLWHDDNGDPILTDHPEVVLSYSDARANEYPSVAQQLDMLWHAIDQGTLDKTSSFYTAIADIKSKYPKV